MFLPLLNVIANSAEPGVSLYLLEKWFLELWCCIIMIHWYGIEIVILVSVTAAKSQILFSIIYCSVNHCCFAFIAIGKSFIFAGRTACRKKIASGGSNHECCVC